jgi:hypothetical protein
MPRTTTVHKGESVTFRLDPVLKAELIRLAEQDDKSLGELLRELARERVAREQHRRFEVEARRQSAAIAEHATRPGTDEYAIMRELEADLTNLDDE